jgi:hypothetical protein
MMGTDLGCTNELRSNINSDTRLAHGGLEGGRNRRKKGLQKFGELFRRFGSRFCRVSFACTR